jgi:hypothetical protein
LSEGNENRQNMGISQQQTQYQQDEINVSPTSPQKSKLNTVLMNIFAKKSTKKKKTTTANNIFNFNHNHNYNQNEFHKSVNIQPKSSKSSPIFPLEHSKWSRQGKI